MAATVVNCARPEEADLVLIAAAYDRTTSFGSGASLGPAAIRDCLDHQIELFDRTSGTSPALDRRIAWVDAGELNELDPEAMVAGLTELCRRHAARPFMLVGGEHSVSNAAFLTHAERADGITILQIDAHADLRADDSDYNDTPWGRYAHCSVMRRAHELGYPLVQVGVRAYSAAERELFDDPRIRVFEWGYEVPRIEQIVAAIPTDEVYLTLDVDGLDPACMPATGTPVPGGLEWYYTLRLLTAVARAKRLVGADVVEVSPRAGDARTEYAAAQLIYTLAGLML
jgi:agmatinase